MFSGLRDVEITRLMVEHVNVTDEIISVHGKGRDGLESLPLVPQVVNVLRDYLHTTKKKSGYLFTSQSKRNYGMGLTTKTVWLIVRDFLDSLGIDRNPHQCRSFYCTELVKKMGNNLFDVIVYTRHKTISTLQSYVNQINKEKTLPKFQKSFSDFILN
jgi:site-specific recombinase XerD